MGYTHYWHRPNEIPQGAFNAFAEDVRKIATKAVEGGTPLGNGDGDADSEPEITEDLVSFNGVREDSHETFYVPRKGEDWDFCKTARKPYDSTVVACLLALRHWVSGVKLSSDGDAPDWREGAILYEEVTGRDSHYLTVV